MTISAAIQKRLDSVDSTFRFLGCTACVEIEHGLDKNESGDDLDTVVVAIGGDRRYATYATSSAVGLSTYLQGLQHGLQLVAGGYSFKPLSQQAKTKPRDSVLKTRKAKAKTHTLKDAGQLPRFAFQRIKYREGYDVAVAGVTD